MGCRIQRALPLLVLGLLAGCGGGGGDGPLGPPSNNDNTYRPGLFQPSSSFANQCAAPRSGTGDRSGSAFTENMFLRSWTNELYLWYSEVPDRDPSGVATANYFDALKTPELTKPSGRPKDQFHFTYPTAVWEQLSQSGIEIGYGVQWVVLSNLPPRKVVVAYVEPGTPAAAQNLTRGTEVLIADNVDVVNGTGNIGAQLDAAFFPTRTGSHTFQVRDVAGAVRNITMNAVEVKHEPVLIRSAIDTSVGRVGYMLFNDHLATAEAQLVNAINWFRTAGIEELVLDLRYNGGGLLDIASELAYMIGGNMTRGQTFERLVFNDKNPTTNPVT
ncbi:MAG TPA: S41 family peptidase, partial [Steroidobacter sp.]|nr:S41 family peptidase [Steroidobacter sp.]